MGFGNICGKEFQAEGTAGEPQGGQRDIRRKSLRRGGLRGI